ncbi:MAG: hypothetical protein MJE66_05280 [Proteobacteria bacterium]|nr:hypothetical protein [Pseudomonadota bacterium]
MRTSEGEVTIVEKDDRYRAEYKIENGIITVRTPRGRKATHLGRSSAPTLARVLLRELIEEGRAEPELR